MHVWIYLYILKRCYISRISYSNLAEKRIWLEIEQPQAKAIQAKSGTEYKYILNTVVTTAEQSQEYRIYDENDFEGYTREDLKRNLLRYQKNRLSRIINITPVLNHMSKP